MENGITFCLPTMNAMPVLEQRELIAIQATAVIVSSYLEHRTKIGAAAYAERDLENLIATVKAKLK